MLIPVKVIEVGLVEKLKALIEEISKVKTRMLNAKMLKILDFICNYKGVAVIKSISVI